MLGIKVEGDTQLVAQKLVSVVEAECVVICAGQFDLLVEVVCEDDEHLLRLVDESVRPIPGVQSTAIFMNLRVAKETYLWGTR